MITHPVHTNHIFNGKQLVPVATLSVTVKNYHHFFDPNCARLFEILLNTF